MKQAGVSLADEFGRDNYTIADVNKLAGTLEGLGAALIKKIAESARSKGLASTGGLTNEKNYKTRIIDNEFNKILEIYMVNYYDYVNEGVKGWGSSANAPASPYQFKSKGMNEEGRKSIKKWLSTKGAITKSVQPKYRIGIEAKGKPKISAEDRMVNTAVWLIKKYGIKQTNYLTEAIESMKTEVKDKVGQAVMKDIKIYLIANTK